MSGSGCRIQSVKDSHVKTVESTVRPERRRAGRSDPGEILDITTVEMPERAIT